jgi:hypothetical protein
MASQRECAATADRGEFCQRKLLLNKGLNLPRHAV